MPPGLLLYASRLHLPLANAEPHRTPTAVPASGGFACQLCRPTKQCFPAPLLHRSLDTGLDGAWVRGIRLFLPLPCMHAAVIGTSNASARAASDCVPPLPANLTFFVGDVPPAQLLARAADSRDGSSVCAAGVAVPAGQPAVIDCGRFLHGMLPADSTVHAAICLFCSRRLRLRHCAVLWLGNCWALLLCFAWHPPACTQHHAPALPQAATSRSRLLPRWARLCRCAMCSCWAAKSCR